MHTTGNPSFWRFIKPGDTISKYIGLTATGRGTATHYYYGIKNDINIDG
jgi:hypothetical protein